MSKLLKTLQQYAKEKGYTRQYVYEIQKKLNVVELPLFVEYQGVKYEVGKQKFVVDEKK